jgi:hypothetical protein
VNDDADETTPPATIGSILRGDAILVGATYLWQLVGLALLAGTQLVGGRGSFEVFFLAGALSFALGFTIRRCDDPDRWALPLTLAATVALGLFGPLDLTAAFAAFSALPLAMIYHGAAIGEHVLTVTPYSGVRSTPVHGGCVRVVGYLALVTLAVLVVREAL